MGRKRSGKRGGNREQWEGEKLMMRRFFYTILRRETRILDITKGDDLAFTSKDGDIHIAGSHPLAKALPPEESRFFLLGVFAHELLHQVYTDFAYMEKKSAGEHDRALVRTAFLFFNLVEDPAIEYRAELVFGGLLLKALRFSIRHIFEKSPEIDEAGDAFTQLVNALVQFGDMGMVKGRFTFRRAYESFLCIAPEFDREVTQGTEKTRLDAAFRWAEETRALWERDASTWDGAKSCLRRMGKHDAEGTGAPFEADPDLSSVSGSEGDARRRALAEKAEKLRKNHGGEPWTAGEEASRGPGEAGWEEEAAAVTTPHWEALGSVSAGSDTGFARAVAEAETAMEQAFRESRIPGRNVYVIPAFRPEQFRYPPGLTCVDERVTDSMAANPGSRGRHAAATFYESVLVEKEAEIRALENNLRTLFRDDSGEPERASSGRYHILRGTVGTTAKIFDRIREPSEISDLAVMILVDESGSMHGEKIRAASRTAIILAEACARLRLPLYVMGFTADYRADVYHRHYVTWTNTKEERVSLGGMSAMASNFDGYSIRCAVEILRRKSAERKLLFVLSDGLPSASAYESPQAAYGDTAAAISEAGRAASVLGIGIGKNCPEDVFRKMYAGHFIPVANEGRLSAVLCRQLERMIREDRR